MSEQYDDKTMQLIEAMGEALKKHGRQVVESVTQELIEKAATPGYNMSGASCKGRATLDGNVILTYKIQFPEIPTDERIPQTEM